MIGGDTKTSMRQKKLQKGQVANFSSNAVRVLQKQINSSSSQFVFVLILTQMQMCSTGTAGTGCKYCCMDMKNDSPTPNESPENSRGFIDAYRQIQSNAQRPGQPVEHCTHKKSAALFLTLCPTVAE